MSNRAIIFGASGALGSAIADRLEISQVEVIRVTRSPLSDADSGWVSAASESWTESLGSELCDRVVFAQGMNAAGGVDAASAEDVVKVFEANVSIIVSWMRDLRASGLLNHACRVCIVGSVWANVARPDKLAYVISKSAVTGLVRSLAIDLAEEGMTVNAVLPGVVDTPMTREFLDRDSIRKLEAETPGGGLVTAQEIAEVCAWLTSPESIGITGQSIVVDKGWSMARYV